MDPGRWPRSTGAGAWVYTSLGAVVGSRFRLSWVEGVQAGAGRGASWLLAPARSLPDATVRSVGVLPVGLTDSTWADEGAFESVATSTTVRPSAAIVTIATASSALRCRRSERRTTAGCCCGMGSEDSSRYGSSREPVFAEPPAARGGLRNRSAMREDRSVLTLRVGGRPPMPLYLSRFSYDDDAMKALADHHRTGASRRGSWRRRLAASSWASGRIGRVRRSIPAGGAQQRIGRGGGHGRRRQRSVVRRRDHRSAAMEEAHEAMRQAPPSARCGIGRLGAVCASCSR